MITLTMTKVFFFKIGNAPFTLFHVLFSIYVLISIFNVRIRNYKYPKFFITVTVFLLLVNLLNINTVKISSFLYMIISTLMILVLYNLTYEVKIKSIERVIKTIIVLFFVNILIASVLILFRVHIPEILQPVFRIYNDPTGQVRPYAFTNEPSYSAILLVFILFVLFKMYNGDLKKNYKWYLLTVITILLIRSSYGYLFLGVFIIYVFIVKMSPKIIIGTFLFLLLFLLSGVSKTFSTKAIIRIVEIGNSILEKGTLESKLDAIRIVDGSAAMRVFPTFELFNYYKKCDLSEVLFGFGAGKSERFFQDLLDEDRIQLGFFPAFMLNYGVVGVILALIMFWNLFPSDIFQKLPMVLLFLLFLFNADYNTQILISILFLVMITKRMEAIEKKSIRN